MKSLNNKNILLIICGGIAAYKSLEIIRLLKKNGVTFDQYSETYSYYAVNQKDLQKINSELIEILKKD